MMKFNERHTRARGGLKSSVCKENTRFRFMLMEPSRSEAMNFVGFARSVQLHGCHIQLGKTVDGRDEALAAVI